MGYLSTLLSGSRITTLLSKIVTWTILLFRKKVFLAFAFYWTFSNTINTVLKYLSGQTGLGQVGQILVEESYTKFLGAGPRILEGLTSLNQFQIGDAIISLWTGFASIYLLLFIYRKLFEFKGIREVEWPEKILVLTVIILATSQVHGVNLLINIVEQIQVFFDTLSSILPTKETSGEALNQTINNTSNSTV